MLTYIIDSGEKGSRLRKFCVLVEEVAGNNRIKSNAFCESDESNPVKTLAVFHSTFLNEFYSSH